MSASTATPHVASSSALSPTMSASPAMGRSSVNARNTAPSHGARSASSLGARPISSTTFQSRNGLAITPDSSAPPSPPLAPLQPSIKALPPPMVASHSSSNRYNATSTPSTSGPNYNISLTAQAPAMQALQPSSGSFMQPLQPQSSSLGQTFTPSMGIQWSSPPIAPQTTPHQSGGPWSSASPGIQPSAPPGWAGTAVLQPTKKETSFDWGDLDPMR